MVQTVLSNGYLHSGYSVSVTYPILYSDRRCARTFPPLCGPLAPAAAITHTYLCPSYTRWKIERIMRYFIWRKLSSWLFSRPARLPGVTG